MLIFLYGIVIYNVSLMSSTLKTLMKFWITYFKFWLRLWVCWLIIFFLWCLGKNNWIKGNSPRGLNLHLYRMIEWFQLLMSTMKYQQENHNETKLLYYLFFSEIALLSRVNTCSFKIILSENTKILSCIIWGKISLILFFAIYWSAICTKVTKKVLKDPEKKLYITMSQILGQIYPFAPKSLLPAHGNP